MTLPIRALSPEVERVYAIGDVHGRADLLGALLRGIEAEAKGRRAAVVFLGDLVDRGPDSRAVLDLAIAAFETWPDSQLCLGNHDEWFLRFLRADPALEGDLDLWLEQGGAETLASYDLARGAPDALRDAVLRSRPAHLPFLQGAARLVTWGDFAFVHAGIDPGVPIAEQSAETCLWIRAPFLRHVGPLERIVVHGHTPQKPARPHVTENRLSLDTGAFFSGVLCAAELDAEKGTLRFLSPGRGGAIGTLEPMPVDRGLGTLLMRSGSDSAVRRTHEFGLPAQKGAARGPPSLAGVSGHEKPDTP